MKYFSKFLIFLVNFIDRCIYLPLSNVLFIIIKKIVPNNSLLYRSLRHVWEVINNFKSELLNKFYNIELFLQYNEKLNKIKQSSLPGFKYYKSPIFSIIIPVYNNYEKTMLCLKSIYLNIQDLEYEVIVIDDNSSEFLACKFLPIKNITYIRNKSNKGFIENCNYGASIARGKYLYFLNNDAIILDVFTLKSMYRVFQDQSNVGVVGSKLIYPNFLLQEAGGIIWDDASAWNYLNKKPITFSTGNFLREVDYVSGASMLINRSVFNKLKGFSDEFKPMYCEDSDFCLKAKNNGLRVIYQPLSEVLHFEGSSAGTDTDVGLKKFQVINSKKLKNKWKKELKHNGPNGIDVYKNFNRSARKKFLIIDHQIPTPDRDAGSVTMYNSIISLLNNGYDVYFLSNSFYSNKYLYEYYKDLMDKGVLCFFPPEFESTYEVLSHFKNTFDYILISRPDVFRKYKEILKTQFTNVPIFYESADLHFLRELRSVNFNAKIDEIKHSYKYSYEKSIIESSLITKFILRSTFEYQLLDNIITQELKNKLAYLEMPYDFETVKKNSYSQNKEYDLLFIGGFAHQPNVDAVIYFIEEIFPIILNRFPSIKFHVVGQNPPKNIIKHKSNNIVIHGYIEDISKVLKNTLITVSPLRFGAGVKGKILLSSAYGIPSVTTSLGVEGSGLKPGHDILIGDNPSDFSQQVINLLSDISLYKRVGNNFYKFSRKFRSNEYEKKFINLLRVKRYPSIFSEKIKFK